MKQYITKVLVVAMLLATTAACDDTFERVNKNPNAVTELDAQYLFAKAVRQTFRGGNSTRLTFPFGGQYAHIYVGRNNSTFIDRYFDHYESDEFKYLYNDSYYGPIRTIEEVMRLTQPEGEQENKVRYALAKIVAIMNYARVADTFGATPYVEGGSGQTGILLPKYDSVEKIYGLMLDELKAAVEVLETADAGDAFPGADPLFFNDMNSWIRLAHSLRLRYAMRARFVLPETTVKTLVEECISSGVIEDNPENAKHENKDSDIGEFYNPLFNSYAYWKWGLSELFVETLKTGADPRLPVFAKPNKSDGEFVGIPNGLDDAELLNWGNWEKVSFPTEVLVGKAATTYYLAAAEMWLLRAEAALFGLSKEDPNELYRTGLRKSFEQWGVADENAEAYFTESDMAVLKGSKEQQFEQIATQLWLSFMSNEGEAWTTIRRTGYPRIAQRTAPVHSLGATNGVMPKRIKYPMTERSINKNNYEDALAEQGPDELTTPLWWDVHD